MYCMFSMESPNNRLLWDMYVETDLYKKVKLCINLPSGFDKLSILMYIYLLYIYAVHVHVYVYVHVYVHVYVLLPFYYEYFSWEISLYSMNFYAWLLAMSCICMYL